MLALPSRVGARLPHLSCHVRSHTLMDETTAIDRPLIPQGFSD